MTQKNIDMMGIIVDKIAEGEKFSKALKSVYSKRNVCIPYTEENLKASIMELKMAGRATNSLLRAKLFTIGDVVKFCEKQKITNVANLGQSTGIEVFEAILDYCWDRMGSDDRVSFLIDTVERNSEYIREEIA